MEMLHKYDDSIINDIYKSVIKQCGKLRKIKTKSPNCFNDKNHINKFRNK